MASLTIKQARRLLGKDADNISDALLEKEIEVATFLKDLFFDNLKKNLKKWTKSL